MEHSTINIDQAQRIIAACHSEMFLVFPGLFHIQMIILNPLESGDGMLIQMVETPDQVAQLINYLSTLLRVQNIWCQPGPWILTDFDVYIDSWNQSSIFCSD